MSDVAEPTAPAAGHAGDLVRGIGLGKFFSSSPGGFGKVRLVRAVQEASIDVGADETVGLVGESGSGKTTLGRLLLRLVEPSFGKVVFDGRDITLLHERDLRPLRRRMQMLFQDAAAALDDRMDVAQIIAEPLKIHRIASGPKDEAERVRGLLQSVGLAPPVIQRRPAELSSGQAQRVNIARALALEPSFLVCDEPVAALDATEQLDVLELLQGLQAARRLALLFISHDLRLVLHASQRVLVMYAGRIVESAASEVLREQARHPYTRALLNAIPELDPKRRRLRLVLEGEPPSPFQPLDGCAFHPRCPRARPGVCDHDPPPLAPPGGDASHEVACWYPDA